MSLASQAHGQNGSASKRLRAATLSPGDSPLGKRTPSVNWKSPSPLPTPLTAPLREDSEPIGEDVTNQLVNLANRMGSHLSTDTLCNTAWLLRYFKKTLPKHKHRTSRLAARNQTLEQRLMCNEDTANVKVPALAPEPPTSPTSPLSPLDTRRNKEMQMKREWRDELFDELIHAIEEFIVRECHPPDTNAAKYWYIMGLHEGPKEEEVASRQTVNFATAASLAVVAVMQIKIHAVRVSQEVNTVSLLAAPASCVAAIAVSCKLFKPRNVLDIDDDFDAWLPLSAVEEIRFTDADNNQRITVVAAIGQPALQCAVDIFTLLPPAPTLTLDLASLTLTFGGEVPLKVSLPWVNLRFLVRALRALADRHSVASNFAEEIPTESEEGPAPGLGVFYMPGDPLGSILKHETEYFEHKRKSSKWSDTDKRTSRRSASLRDESEGILSPSILSPTTDRGDEDTFQREGSPPRGRRSLTPTPASTMPYVAGLSPAKGRKTKSVFEPLMASGLMRESMLLKDLWQALAEGVREMCGAIRRATNTNTTLPLLGPFFTAVQALGIRMSASYSEVDSIRRLTCDFNDLFTTLASRIEYSPTKLLGIQPSEGTLKTPRKPDKGLGSSQEREKEKDRHIIDLKERVELAENTIIDQGAAITTLTKENERLHKQMKGAAQLLKADKKALLEREQLKEAIKEVEEMAAAVATMKLEVVQYLSNIESPTPIQKSLGTIAWMLQEYRRFLPTAILETDRQVDDGDDDEQREATRPPPDGTIAMVFTDIQSSTALWEAATEGMTVGLQAHNKIMRDAIKKYDGYEVKTIGDSFMVAFDSAYAACSFALEVQVELTKHEWGPDLLQCPDCATYEYEGNVVWHGLRVRIGIHYGPAEMQKNPITGRADYFGPTVNKAARVEAAATGGLVAVTANVLKELDAKQFEMLGDPVVIPYGGVTLKGVTGATDISGLLPRTLGARRSEVGPQELRGTAPDGTVAILACDVQNSAGLWQSDPKNMALAVKLLHDVISAQLADNNGYEAQRKAEGYTLVFHNAYDACRFALNAQTLLMEQPWPQDLLLNVDACEKKRDGITIWKGLRLRVGIHYGGVETETNPLTKKIEYFGPAAKLAPRVCSESCGGLVLVTQEVLDSLGEQKLGLLGEPMIIKHGTTELPNISEPVTLSSLYTRALAGREEDCVPSCCLVEPKENVSKKVSTFGAIKNIKVGLKLVKATVAYVALNITVVNARDTFRALSSVVTAVEFAAERTEGLVASVYGKTLIVCWNAGRKCTSHETQAVRFANLLHHRLRGGTIRVNVGVASGDVLHGVVAGEKKRFTTAIGGCVDAAKALCETCKANGNFCLISDQAVELSVIPEHTEYTPGDTVLVRDSETQDWLRGVVTDVDPAVGVSVQPDGYKKSSVWVYIRPWEPDTPQSPPTPNKGKRRLGSIISFRRDRMVSSQPTDAQAATGSTKSVVSVVSPIQCVPWKSRDTNKDSDSFGSPAHSCYSSPSNTPSIPRANSLTFGKKGQTQYEPMTLSDAGRSPEVRSSAGSSPRGEGETPFSSRPPSGGRILTEAGERIRAMEQQMENLEADGDYEVTRVESGEMSPMGSPVEAALSPEVVSIPVTELVPNMRTTPEIRSPLDLRSPADYLFPAPGADRTRRASSPAIVQPSPPYAPYTVQQSKVNLSPLSTGSGPGSLGMRISGSPALTASPLQISTTSPTTEKPPLRPIQTRSVPFPEPDSTELVPVRKIRSDTTHTVTFLSPAEQPLEIRRKKETSPRMLPSPTSEGSVASSKKEWFDVSPKRVPISTKGSVKVESRVKEEPAAEKVEVPKMLTKSSLVAERLDVQSLMSPTKLSPVKDARKMQRSETQLGTDVVRLSSAVQAQAQLKVRDLGTDTRVHHIPGLRKPEAQPMLGVVGVEHVRVSPTTSAPEKSPSKVPEVPKHGLPAEQVKVSPGASPAALPNVGSPLSIGKISQLSPKPVPIGREADYHAVAPDARDWVDWPTRSTAAKKAQTPSTKLAKDETVDRLKRSNQQCPVLAEQNKGLVYVEKSASASRILKPAVSRFAEPKATTSPKKQDPSSSKVRELRPVSAPLLGIFKKG
eukprot:TRINITY_DN14617_c0_g1_i1.p1 TRINITY_DN14617_c0_g1~~TRINITY_DN14617_c0_g1_i1.p1  ORF type:complete len:2084 (+),score=445.27 TRINITY_DN14617_c0_g1_i1:31-6282(+)